MGSSPEEFAELRRLLAMKRAEQPPPGYFNTFAGKVIARIEAEGLAAPKPWWVRWMTPTTGWSPGLAGANTAIFAGLAMLGGAAWYFKSKPEKVVGREVADQRQDRLAEAVATSGSAASTDGRLQFSGFDPQQFLPPLTARASLVTLPPLTQFQIDRPSVRERMVPAEADTVPAGIFGPWSSGGTLPTSIMNYVEPPRR